MIPLERGGSTMPFGPWGWLCCGQGNAREHRSWSGMGGHALGTYGQGNPGPSSSSSPGWWQWASPGTCQLIAVPGARVTGTGTCGPVDVQLSTCVHRACPCVPACARRGASAGVRDVGWAGQGGITPGATSCSTEPAGHRRAEHQGRAGELQAGRCSYPAPGRLRGCRSNRGAASSFRHCSWKGSLGKAQGSPRLQSE